METVTSTVPVGHSETLPPKKERVTRISSFLKSQMDLQNKLGCDYALLWYERDANSPPGQMPNYICIGDPIPVKLSHHAFMQLAFGILKDRLQKLPTRQKSQSTGIPQKSKAKEEEGKEEEEKKKEEEEKKEPEREQSPLAGGSGEAPRRGPMGAKGRKARERDTVALFCFLWHYATSMMEAERDAIRAASGNAGSQSRDRHPSLSPVIRMTKQQLRFQMLLEHGVDVHKTLGDGLPTANVITEEYCQELMADSITEEEFYQQLSKSSRMAQVCSVM